MISRMASLTLLHHGGPLDGQYTTINYDNEPPARIYYPTKADYFMGVDMHKIPTEQYEVFGVEDGVAPVRGKVASARYLGRADALPGLVHYA